MITIMMMMMVIGMMRRKINFSSGKMVLNKRRLKKALTHCLAPIKILRSKKERQKNCRDKHGTFVSDDQIQNVFDPKRVTKKNVSFDSTFSCRVIKL